MEHELATEHGELKFRLHVKLTGAEPRDKPYSNGKYLPAVLKFTLESSGLSTSPHPRYKDLSTGSLSLFGYALKKDGTPGQREVTETIYTWSDYPAWIREIVNEHANRLREGRP